MTSPSGAERIFAALYFDEDVSLHIVRALQNRGFDATCPLDRQALSQSDTQQLERAVAERRALVTHNRKDFEALHEKYVAQGKRHFGIVLAVRRADYRVTVGALLKLLDTFTADEFEGKLLFV